MAGIIVRATAVPQALVASEDTTLLMVKAGAQQRIKVREFSISFNGTDNLGVPIECQLLRLASDGTGDAVTEVDLNESTDETLQTAATEGYGGTNEPTAGAILERKFVHPQSSWHVVVADPDNFTVKGGNRIGLKCISPAAAITAVAWIEWEE